ncbi:MAG: acyl-coenzyme A synthetase/AMP-(fatty) acid ligase [Paracoccaceae bacterium]|jgi:acyl-coenzyme A synthetase/AMP-(fatty) acid ligase
MAAYVLSQVAANPDKPALEILGKTSKQVWTYRQLEQAVLATAGGLQSLGLPQGARILLRLSNDVEFPILFLAAIAAGYLPVPSSAQLTAPEIAYLIQDLDPALIICGIGIDPPVNARCTVLGPKDIDALAQHTLCEYWLSDPNRPAYIIYTSGTSGRPNGVVHAHRAVWARRMMWDGWYGLTADDRLLHAGAFNWTYTLGTGLMDPWAIGATALIATDDVDRPALASLLRDQKASIFAAAPGVYRQLLNCGADLDLPDLRHSLSAGEQLPTDLKTAWEQATNGPIFEALGMSEVSTFISSSPSNPDITTAQVGRKIAVLDDVSHEILPVETAGILAVSRDDPGLMLGYLNAASETAAKFHDDWFLTGDTVSMAANGAITYLGRQDDMMNAGGYRVSPIEVEAALNHHADITQSAAVMIQVKPDTFVIAAYYQSDIDLADTTLHAFCETRLARYKCPRIFVRIAELPKGANGKLRRGVLRDKYDEN